MKERIANVCELQDLNEFIRLSKGYWGYPKDFLDTFIEKWGLTENYILKNQVIVLEENNVKCGLFSFSQSNAEKVELDLFFINSQYIRKGMGKEMWKIANHYASEKKFEKFELIADPNAKGFFEKMGAKKIKTLETFPGRFVPIMESIVIMPDIEEIISCTATSELRISK